MPNLSTDVKPKFQTLEERLKNKVNDLKDPEKLKTKNKLAIVFDTSGSMAHHETNEETYVMDPKSRIDYAKLAVKGFVDRTDLNINAIGIMPFVETFQELSFFNYSSISTDIISFVNGLNTLIGHTPLCKCILNVLNMEEKPSRVIVFSDGEATDKYPSFLNEIKKDPPLRTIVIDTVAIGQDSYFLKQIAEATGGIYLFFKDISQFAGQLKYLSPQLRFLLTSQSVIDKVQKGEQV